MRYKAATAALKRSLPDTIPTIISDDCWGGTFYRHIDKPYTTPFVGLWIDPEGYLDLVSNLYLLQYAKLRFIYSAQPYPVAEVLGVKVYFKHYKSRNEAESKWYRRLERSDLESACIKIDFGKAGYVQEDVLKWQKLNDLKKLALLPANSDICEKVEVDNAVYIPEWCNNGRCMYGLSLPHFSFNHWIRHGTVKNAILNQKLWSFPFPEI